MCVIVLGRDISISARCPSRLSTDVLSAVLRWWARSSETCSRERRTGFSFSFFRFLVCHLLQSLKQFCTQLSLYFFDTVGWKARRTSGVQKSLAPVISEDSYLETFRDWSVDKWVSVPFNGHIPGGPGLTGTRFIGAKDDEGGGDNQS